MKHPIPRQKSKPRHALQEKVKAAGAAPTAASATAAPQATVVRDGKVVSVQVFGFMMLRGSRFLTS